MTDVRPQTSDIRNTDEPTRGQASLEMTVALMGAILLLLGSLKVFLWTAERLITRQQNYEATRVEAGSSEPGQGWEEPSEPLRIFNE